MRRILALIAVFTTWTAIARAEPTPCYGLDLAAAWKQGYEAYASGAFENAQDILMPLAENGFAPAQWLVGRMIAEGQGAQKDDITALMWLKLAGLGQITQARPVASKIESTLDMAGFEQVRRRQESWMPKRTASCQDAAAIPTKFGDDGTVQKSSQQLMQWWGDFVTDAIERRPEAIPYLLTLPTVLFSHGQANASVMRHEGRPILVIDESLVERTMPEVLQAVLPAAREAVNEAALAAVFTAPVEIYKGRNLRGSPAGDNQAFLAVMRQAIDMTAKLPSPLRDKAGRIRDIRYEPRYVHGTTINNSMTGLFVADKTLPGGGYMAFQVNPATTSAAITAMGLVAMASLAAHAADGDSDALQCRIALDSLQVAKALDLGAEQKNALSREIGRRNCIK